MGAEQGWGTWLHRSDHASTSITVYSSPSLSTVLEHKRRTHSGHGRVEHTLLKSVKNFNAHNPLFRCSREEATCGSTNTHTTLPRVRAHLPRLLSGGRDRPTWLFAAYVIEHSANSGDTLDGTRLRGRWQARIESTWTAVLPAQRKILRDIIFIRDAPPPSMVVIATCSLHFWPRSNLITLRDDKKLLPISNTQLYYKLMVAHPFLSLITNRSIRCLIAYKKHSTS